MELVKKNIHMNRWKNHAATQITLDDDFIVPDTMDDMEQIVLDTGSIQIETSRPRERRCQSKGNWISVCCTGGKAEGFRPWEAPSLLRKP